MAPEVWVPQEPLTFQRENREGAIVRGEIVSPKMGRVRFSELAEDLVSDYNINSRRSLRDLKMRLKRHLLPFFGHRRASRITTADVRCFIAIRQEQDATAGEINRELAALKRPLSLAIQDGKLAHKPHIPMLKETNIQQGFFEPEQFEAVRNHLPEELRGLVTFFYITGWRLSEVLNLQWRQVDLKVGSVYLDPGTTKNDEGRVFPFTEELAQVLQSQREYTDTIKKEAKICPWVFHRDGKQVRSFRRSWLSACKKAGVPGRIVHDLRRTAVRNLVRSGVPERVAMQLTGHKTRSVFERYNIVSEGDLVEAAKRLDRIALS